jgi:hypothetical protein
MYVVQKQGGIGRYSLRCTMLYITLSSKRERKVRTIENSFLVTKILFSILTAQQSCTAMVAKLFRATVPVVP